MGVAGGKLVHISETNGIQTSPPPHCRFHFAGVSSKNVTLGVPRFKELLDCSRNIRTPSMTLTLKNPVDGNAGFCDWFARGMQYTVLGDLVASSIVSSTIEGIEQEDTSYILEMADLMRLEPLEDPSHHWIIVHLDRRKMFARGVESVYEVADAARHYLAERAEVLSTEHSMQSCALLVRFVNVGTVIAASKLGEIEIAERRSLESTAMHRLRDTLLEKLHVRGIPNITRSFTQRVNQTIFDSPGDAPSVRTGRVIETEGSNLVAALSLNIIDPNSVRSNDVHEVFGLLGIEAAQATLASEMYGVLSFDGTYINARHLDLLTQTITQLGYLCRLVGTG